MCYEVWLAGGIRGFGDLDSVLSIYLVIFFFLDIFGFFFSWCFLRDLGIGRGYMSNVIVIDCWVCVINMVYGSNMGILSENIRFRFFRYLF